MDKNTQIDSWCIVEDDFQPKKALAAERIFSLTNGYVAQRANFEEYFSGNTKLEAYIADLYCQCVSSSDSEVNKSRNNLKQRINTPYWNGVIVRLNDEILDLATWEIQNFRRVLNMHDGFLERTFEVISPRNHAIQVTVKRFLSMAETEVAAISYSVKSLNFDGRVSFMPVIDANVLNPDSDEQLWNVLQVRTQQDVSHLWAQARHMTVQFCGATSYVLYKNNEQLKIIPTKIEKERIAGFSVGTDVRIGDTVCLNKFIAVTDSLTFSSVSLPELACEIALNARKKGWNKLFEEHSAAMQERWSRSEVIVEDDIEIQRNQKHRIFMGDLNLDEDQDL